jgi:ribosomal protein L24E
VPRPRRLPFRAGLALIATFLLAAIPLVTPRLPGATAATPAAAGYWLVGGDGSVYGYGPAGDLGSLKGTRLAKPVVGMTPTPSGAGYWLVASDGGIFSFGDAKFFGSTGAIKLNQPIVGMAATPSGQGYWFVAADGGIFSFGDAKFYGSTGALKLNKPIVGMAPTPSGKGYWFVASDGGIFNFGDATFQGSAGGKSLPAGIVVMSGVRPGGSTASTDPTGPGDTTDPTATVTTTPSTVTTGPAPTGEAFQIGLVGDTGYRPEQYSIFDRVVQQMNTFPLAFVVHDGDFKDPTRQSCDDDLFAQVKKSFDKSAAPFVYTPGDNEWMDCDKIVNGPMDRLDRLNKLREMFFAQDQSLGQHPMPLTTQRQDGYPENARWIKEGVVFATINAPGPNDDIDYCGPAGANPCQVGYESGPRRVANKAWLRQTFEIAKQTNAPAVMIVWQVDPWQPATPTNPRNRRNWDYLLGCDDQSISDCREPGLHQMAKEFGKPVVLVHGDTHIPRIDKGGWPQGPNAPDVMVGAFDDLPNFTRVETYAGGQAVSAGTQVPPEPKNWVRVTVDPKDPKVFTFTTETAPGSP